MVFAAAAVNVVVVAAFEAAAVVFVVVEQAAGCCAVDCLFAGLPVGYSAERFVAVPVVHCIAENAATVAGR